MVNLCEFLRSKSFEQLWPGGVQAGLSYVPSSSSFSSSSSWIVFVNIEFFFQNFEYVIQC